MLVGVGDFANQSACRCTEHLAKVLLALCSRDVLDLVGFECAVSIATLQALDLLLFAISVRLFSAMSMYCLMIVSSVSVLSLSFFLILL
jgi:hypothetical protein